MRPVGCRERGEVGYFPGMSAPPPVPRPLPLPGAWRVRVHSGDADAQALAQPGWRQHY